MHRRVYNKYWLRQTAIITHTHTLASHHTMDRFSTKSHLFCWPGIRHIITNIWATQTWRMTALNAQFQLQNTGLGKTLQHAKINDYCFTRVQFQTMSAPFGVALHHLSPHHRPHSEVWGARHGAAHNKSCHPGRSRWDQRGALGRWCKRSTADASRHHVLPGWQRQQYPHHLSACHTANERMTTD